MDLDILGYSSTKPTEQSMRLSPADRTEAVSHREARAKAREKDNPARTMLGISSDRRG